MVQIAFLLLCHKDPAAIVAQAERLTAVGDCVAIHFDARAPAADFARIEAAVAGNPRVALVSRRVRCGWGEWSLVEATRRTADLALRTFAEATHFYMVSGDCMPIKPAAWLHRVLEEPADHIECVDFYEGGWIKTGMKEDRLIYRHFLNERKYKRAFYWMLDAQRAMGLKRRVPDGLTMRIGSQWWCLRRGTLEAVLSFARRRRDVARFFATTWIPDETFFQTLVPHLVPEAEIRCRTLTFLAFTDYGMPLTFYDDHYDLLMGQDAAFARKISPEAEGLKARLGDLYAREAADVPISGEGRALHAFLTGLGREGVRFAPRLWEEGAGRRPGQTLLILVCKKWHVGKRLATLIRELGGVASVEYLFNEEGAALPELGGLERPLEKRSRHRRALVRILFERLETERLVICLDPAMSDLAADLLSDRGETRVLEVSCEMDDDYLAGHARRVGLAGPATPAHALAALVPPLRRSVEQERARLAALGVPLARVCERAEPRQNALSLADFLGIDDATAREIVETPGLFDD